MIALEHAAAQPAQSAFTERIKARALELGFDKVGIVPAATLSEEHARLAEWLRRGYHGEMPYLARDPEQRTDPRKLFPDAKSVIVVALNYYTAHEHEVRTACVSGRLIKRNILYPPTRDRAPHCHAVQHPVKLQVIDVERRTGNFLAAFFARNWFTDERHWFRMRVHPLKDLAMRSVTSL